MTAKPFSIAMHVGVHKTATSHLQRCLNKVAEPLAADGVRYRGPAYFRNADATIAARFGFAKNQDISAPTPDTAEALAVLRAGADRLVISEENFMGVLNAPRDFSRRQRYEAAAGRLNALSDATGHKLDVFLGVRRPTDFINSVYGQLLFGGQIRPIGAYLRQNPLQSVDWLDLVRRVRGARGVGQVTVWRYEDYAALFDRIVAGLVGPEHAHHVQFVARNVNPGLSATAVAEVLHRHACGQDLPKNFGAIARTILPLEAGFPRFDAYTPDEHARGDAVYAAQIDAIDALDGVTLLRPDPA